MQYGIMFGRLSALAICFSASLFIDAPAQAWSPPEVGKACPKISGAGNAVTLISGNYLGGKLMQSGMVDRVSFQACFEDEQTCSSWLAEMAVTHPLKPGYARCTVVLVR